jgi:hypothetical protein
MGVVCTEMGEGHDTSAVVQTASRKATATCTQPFSGKSGVCCRDHEAAAMPIGSLPMTPNQGWYYVSCARCCDAEGLVVADAILCWRDPGY